MIEASPSKVRARALHEYESLRHTLDELEGMAERLLAEGGPAADEALIVTAKLLREFSDYVDLEQLLVLPAVRGVDIWGDIRADELAKGHETRRNDLGAIERSHPQPVDPQSLASDLRQFARGLRAALEREEREVLGVNALKDDVVETEPD